VGRPVGVREAVGEPLAEGAGLDDAEPDGVDGNELGVAGAVAVEEGTGEAEGTGVPGLLCADATTSTGSAGDGAAASAIPVAIAAMPPTAPAPSSTGVHEEAWFLPDSGPSAVTGCLPVVRPNTRRSSTPMVATRAGTTARRPRHPGTRPH
jgi:hypothetical protein